ncbi:hypothetical protein X798_02194 [Onchocerca flexuosa]|uniref:Uncharacterized protein n=1 Tax=Onchocerca flexuosa TaxID=387005 RepID=A0A238BZT0_9BILA|nr:hypothetical protein X798_02194 [Onchocerca flexuosa]
MTTNDSEAQKNKDTETMNN